MFCFWKEIDDVEENNSLIFWLVYVFSILILLYWLKTSWACNTFRFNYLLFCNFLSNFFPYPSSSSFCSFTWFLAGFLNNIVTVYALSISLSLFLLQVLFQLLYTVLSYLGTFSTIYMLCVHIYGVFLLPFVCWLCGHHLM